MSAEIQNFDARAAEFDVEQMAEAAETQAVALEEAQVFDERVVDSIRTRIMWVRGGSPYVEIADLKGLKPGQEPTQVQNVAMPANVNMYDEQQSPFHRPGMYME